MVRKSLPCRSDAAPGAFGPVRLVQRLRQALRRQGAAAWLVEVPLLAAIVSAVVLASTSWSALW
jgi:Flp pilus assembly pilin Flp